MSIPFPDLTLQPNPSTREITPEINQIIQNDAVIVRALFQELSEELPDLNKFRDYYDGEQELVYGSDKFKELFPGFQGFEDNWCAPVIDAMADKIKLIGLHLDEQEDETSGEEGSLTEQIWNAFRDNDIDEQQADLTEGVFVEGRAAVIVWPDDEIGARIDWNPAQLVKVRYSEDDYRKVDFAIKRWRSPGGQIFVNVYDSNQVRKYIEGREPSNSTSGELGISATIPKTSPSVGLNPRFVDGEAWPLPHEFGEVPVVEFENKRGSELSDVIPLQDGINYLLIAAFVATEFDALRQRVFMTHLKEPDGGWKSGPGQIWHLPPFVDADGRMTHGEAHEFQASDLSAYRTIIEMVLQHLALTSKTPVRMFFKSDRGGRGDAPSGDSQLIEDEPLLDKVDDRMTRLGNKWFQVVKLVAKALDIEVPIRGEVIWKNPMSKYRSSLIEEAIKLANPKSGLGLPVEWVIERLGLTPEELVELREALEEQKAEQEELRQEALAQGNQQNSEGEREGEEGNGPPNEASN